MALKLWPSTYSQFVKLGFGHRLKELCRHLGTFFHLGFFSYAAAPSRVAISEQFSPRS